SAFTLDANCRSRCMRIVVHDRCEYAVSKCKDHLLPFGKIIIIDLLKKDNENNIEFNLNNVENFKPFFINESPDLVANLCHHIISKDIPETVSGYMSMANHNKLKYTNILTSGNFNISTFEK
ncbi:hypothetical protein, partial [Cysteiniphilum litorale]|uniref:hypothetical protein n=1 Tax=Cysteiniphilum litorale TaxID=2056700 RepID=UPI003F880C99